MTPSAVGYAVARGETRDKFIITFCLTGFRAAMGYAFLRTQGFDEIKALKGRLYLHGHHDH